MYQYIARITVYDPNGKTYAIRYDSWSANYKASQEDVARIEHWAMDGLFDNSKEDMFSTYFKAYGHAISIYECNEVILVESTR